MILEEETYKRFGYYSHDLKPRSWKRIVVACDGCGTVHETSKHDYHALCVSCCQKGKTLSEETKHKIHISCMGINKGAEHGSWKGGLVKRICEICKNEFEVAPSEIRRRGGKFCSRKCASIAQQGENNHQWKGGLEERVCFICGNIFSPSRDNARKGRGKFCSCSCSAKARIHNAKPEKTQPEIRFDEICTKYTLPFRFVGDGTLWLGNANPDFIHDTRKLCVEIFGDYWHSPLLNCGIKYKMTVDGRRKQLKAEGYKLIVIWESDLKRKDAEAFVLNKLKSFRIFSLPKTHNTSQ